MVRRSIDTPPNWGDFKAITTLPHSDVQLASFDTEAQHLVVLLPEGPATFEVGGPQERFTRAMKRWTRDYVRLVRWQDIWVIGIPVPGRARVLFRARELGA